MPELPEIEHLKRTLEPALLGATVVGVQLKRRDIAHRSSAAACRDDGSGPAAKPDPKNRKPHRKPRHKSESSNSASPSFTASSSQRVRPQDLLAGQRIVNLVRHGKNLAIISEAGRVMCVHLGMSGQMMFLPQGRRAPKADHIHCIWTIESPARGSGRLIFRDPRRFGGLWVFESMNDLQGKRWGRLGPDALSINPKDLRLRLARTTRPIKAALLEQTVLAGVGNIYADEALFLAGIHPEWMADSIEPQQVIRLAKAIAQVMGEAIEAGGSSIRSYVDGNGRGGAFAVRHRVYGRGGQPCVKCGQSLAQATIAQRTTVFCERCQVRR